MYTSLSIQNFRGIHTLEMNDLRRVNILTGRNNCGKTSVLEAVYLLSQSTNPSASAQFRIYRNFKNLEADYWRSFFYNFVTSNVVTLLVDKVVIEGDYSNDHRSLVIEPWRHFSSTDYESFLQERLLEEGGLINGLSLTYLLDTFETSSPLTVQLSIANLKEQGGFEVFPKEPPTIVPPVLSLLFVHPSYFANAEKRFSRLELNKETGTVVKALQQIEPAIKYIRFINDIFYCDVGKDRLLPLNVMGDGMVRLFSIILAIATTPGGAVLIDEVDTGFHYSTLEVMWKAVYAAAKQFDVQIFATTHSYECLRALGEYLEGHTTESENDSTCLYRIDRRADEHKAVRFDQREFITSLEHFWEVR